MKEKLKKYWFALTHPYVIIGWYDKDWDELMELYIDSEDYVFRVNEKIREKDYFYAFSILNKETGENMLDREVWISTGRSSAGHLYKHPQGLSQIRPSKLTIYKMFQKLWRQMTAEQKLVYGNNFNKLYKGCN